MNLPPFDDNLDQPQTYYCIVDGDGRVGELLTDAPVDLADDERVFGVVMRKLRVKAREILRAEMHRDYLKAGLDKVADPENPTSDEALRMRDVEQVASRKLLAKSIVDWNYHLDGKPVDPSFDAIMNMNADLFSFLEAAFDHLNTVKNSKSGLNAPLTDSTDSSA